MLITISKLLALALSFSITTQSLIFGNVGMCWAKASQKEIIAPDFCSEFHVFRNNWCEGVCTSEYTEDKLGGCIRNCPAGWPPIFHNCIKPLGIPRRMSFPFWDTPDGIGCDAGYHVSEYVKITCTADCPARMKEVSLETACEKDQYRKTNVETKCRPGYEKYRYSCRGCGNGSSAFGDVCVTCPPGTTQCGVACVPYARNCDALMKDYMTSNLGAIETFVRSAGFCP
jgi:hypothetical protein